MLEWLKNLLSKMAVRGPTYLELKDLNNGLQNVITTLYNTNAGLTKGSNLILTTIAAQSNDVITIPKNLMELVNDTGATYVLDEDDNNYYLSFLQGSMQ